MTASSRARASADPLLLLDIHHSGYFGWGVWVSADAPARWTAETVERLIRHPNYKMGLNLGAQTYENDPELSRRIRAWLEMFPDRLFVTGGDYAQPTACVRSGESNLRHLLVGREQIRRDLGVTVDIWTASEPGNFAQLPQILKDLGYRAALLRIHGPGQLGSPVPTADAGSVWWSGPDGTKILAVPEYEGDREKPGDACTRSMWMMTRYRNRRAKRGDFSLDDLWEWKLEQERKGISPVVMSKDDDQNNQHGNNNLCMDAGHALAADTEADPRFRWVTAEELFAQLPVPKETLTADPNLFETRVHSFCDYGFMGNRDWVEDVRTETALRNADFACVLAAELSRDPKMEHDLATAWKLHLAAQNHDSSLKGLCMVMYHLQQEAARVSEAVFRKATGSVTRKIRTGEGAGSVVVMNPLGLDRVGYATIRLPEQVAKGGTLYSRGRQVPWEVVSREAEDVEMGFVAEVPSFGYRTYSIKQGSSPARPRDLVVKGRTVVAPHYRVTFGAKGGIEELSPAGGNGSLIVPGSSGLAGDIGGEPVRSQGHLEIETGAVSAIAREEGWLGKFHRYEVSYRMIPDVAHVDVRVRVWPDFKEGTPGAPGRAGDPQDKVRFSVGFDPGLGAIRCVRQQPFLVWDYDPAISPVFAALAWVDYEGTSAGLAMLNDGAVGQQFDPSSRAAGCILLSGTAGDYRGHLGILPHSGDWRRGLVHESGQSFETPLVAVFEGPHSGSLPEDFSFAAVSPANLTASSLFRVRGTTYLRVWEHAGETAETEFTRDGEGIPAERVNLRFRRSSGGARVGPRKIAMFRML